MEPKMPTPNVELPPTPVQPEANHETSIGVQPERAPEHAPERVEHRAEGSSQAIAPILPAPVLPTLPDPIVADDSTQSADDGMPLVAADDDLIEKEWVDKAKQIIQETKDDPYRREQEVSKLQVDYLRKRYGKELGVSQ